MRFIALFILLFSVAAYATPVVERDGDYFRVYNPDSWSYYCWFVRFDGRPDEGILYPGDATPWMRYDEIKSWGCE